jgi:Mn2+/Fe2+ NRAMP family transporter
MGPGIVFALTVLGAGSVVANAAAGASSGYSLLWVLALAVFFRYVWLAVSARYVLVTGEPLIAGYARLGKWFLWSLWLALLLMAHLYTLYAIALMGFSFDVLLPLPWGWSAETWGLFFTLAGFGMCFWGGYPAVETVCKVLLALMGGALVAVAILSEPDVGGIVRGTLIPGGPAGVAFGGTVPIVVALIGTEAGSITNLTYSYFMYEKGWRDVSHLTRQKRDLLFSVVAVFLMAALLQIAAAGTLFQSGVEVRSAEDLVRIFSDRLGEAGRVIFALGLWAATFTTFVGANTGYAVVFSDITRRLVPGLRPTYGTAKDRVSVGRDRIYQGSLAFWALSPLYVLFTKWDAAFLALLVSSIVVFLIPLLGYGLLWLSASRERMGEYRNRPLTNALLVLLILVSVYFTATTVWGWVR